MKILQTATVLIFATLCVASDRPICPSCLTEPLSGVVDGKNDRFSLSRVPDTTPPIQIYRNGVPVDSADYQAIGNTVTFTSRQTPVAGDILEAIYKPASRQLQPARSTSRSSVSAAGEEISSALARQALSAELTVLSGPEPNTKQIASPSPAEADDASPRHNAKANHPKGKRESQKNKDISAQGVDGLGDNSLESDSTDVENSDSSGGGFQSALQLLERRLKSQQQSVADFGRAPQNDATNNPH